MTNSPAERKEGMPNDVKRGDIVEVTETTKKEISEDAYGRDGFTRYECGACGGKGIEYEETCVTCGGKGFVCDDEKAEKCSRCDATDFSPNVEAFELSGEVVCEECAEEIFEENSQFGLGA